MARGLLLSADLSDTAALAFLSERPETTLLRAGKMRAMLQMWATERQGDDPLKLCIDRSREEHTYPAKRWEQQLVPFTGG